MDSAPHTGERRRDPRGQSCGPRLVTNRLHEERPMTNPSNSTNLFALAVEDDAFAIKNFARALLFIHDGQPDHESDLWKVVHHLALEISEHADNILASLDQPKAAA